jgi:hypothetical protein
MVRRRDGEGQDNEQVGRAHQHLDKRSASVVREFED